MGHKLQNKFDRIKKISMRSTRKQAATKRPDTRADTPILSTLLKENPKHISHPPKFFISTTLKVTLFTLFRVTLFTVFFSLVMLMSRKWVISYSWRKGINSRTVSLTNKTTGVLNKDLTKKQKQQQPKKQNKTKQDKTINTTHLGSYATQGSFDGMQT